MTESECDGCLDYHYVENKGGHCGLVDRKVRDMDDCPVEQPEE